MQQLIERAREKLALLEDQARAMAQRQASQPENPPKTYVVRRLRMRSGLTQHEFAGRVGVSDRTVRTWETKGIPPESASHPTSNTRAIILKAFQGILRLTKEDREEIENENRE